MRALRGRMRWLVGAMRTTKASGLTELGNTGKVKCRRRRGASAGRTCGTSGRGNQNGRSLAGGRSGATRPGGLWFKFTLVTRAAFNQGFALPHLPVRGVRRSEV